MVAFRMCQRCQNNFIQNQTIRYEQAYGDVEAMELDEEFCRACILNECEVTHYEHAVCNGAHLCEPEQQNPPCHSRKNHLK